MEYEVHQMNGFFQQIVQDHTEKCQISESVIFSAAKDWQVKNLKFFSNHRAKSYLWAQNLDIFW